MVLPMAYFLMKAKIPQERGTWPALWLVNGDNWSLNGKIDVK